MLTLTIDRGIIYSLIESILNPEKKKISLVYFEENNSYYFFPLNNHSKSLTGDAGYLTRVSCEIFPIKDEVEKLLSAEESYHSEPIIWEVESGALFQYAQELQSDNDISEIHNFLDHLSTWSRIFLNKNFSQKSSIDFQGIRPNLIYSDAKKFTKINVKNSLEPNEESNKMQARTLLWLGKDNQSKINSFKIGCIGAGGLMNPFMIQAMHHGFKNFAVIDHDRLEAHNLNRFLNANKEDIGLHKADVLKRILMEYDSSIKIDTSISSFPDDGTEKLLSSCDILVCGVDNDYTRVNAQLLALALHKPLLDMGSGIFLKNNTSLNPEVDERGGQIRLSIPGEGCLACMGLNLSRVKDFKRENFDRTRGYIAGTELTPPSIITLNIAIASIALKLLVDYITGGISSRHIKYNEKDLKLYHVIVNRELRCPVCG